MLICGLHMLLLTQLLDTLLIVDDSDRFIWIFFLKTKDEAQIIFISFMHMFERNEFSFLTM